VGILHGCLRRRQARNEPIANIKKPPIPPPLPEAFTGRVLIVLPDNISTGSMAPDGAVVMADRSNVEAIAGYTFMKEDPEFVQRAKDWSGGFIVAGENYGQGSSREHAALAPWPWVCVASWPRGSPVSTGAT
jgi:aconitate hydratase